MMSLEGGNTERISASRSLRRAVSFQGRGGTSPPVPVSAVLNSIMKGIGTWSGCASDQFFTTVRQSMRV